jgi:hypothetical protein
MPRKPVTTYRDVIIPHINSYVYEMNNNVAIRSRNLSGYLRDAKQSEVHC